MTTTKRYDNPEAFKELLTSLLQEQSISCSFVSFGGSNEGKALPGGIESSSGEILTEDGRVFRYWLEWDPDKTAPDGTKGWYTLGENRFYDHGGEKRPYFEEILPGSESFPKPDDTSYLTAKRKLNLPLTEGELDILREYWNITEMRRELRLD